MSLDECVFQATDSKGQVRGTGFAISPNLVVTCAHVVKGCNPTKGELFLISYPEKNKLKAQVLIEGLNLEKDIAFLRLNSPFPSSAKHMGERLGSFGSETEIERSFRAFGYHNIRSDIKCLWAKGLIKGQIRNDNGDFLLQLGSQDITFGMSGSPVMDVQSGLIVGIVQKTQIPDATGKLRDLAYALPIEVLGKLSPDKLVIKKTSDWPFHHIKMSEELKEVLDALYADKQIWNQPITRADLFHSLVRSRIGMVDSSKQSKVIAMLDDFDRLLKEKTSIAKFDVTDAVKGLIVEARRLYAEEISKDRLGVIELMEMLLNDSGENIKRGLEKHDFKAAEILFQMKYRSSNIFSNDIPKGTQP